MRAVAHKAGWEVVAEYTDQSDDLETVEELRALFLELWDLAQVLTSEKLDVFTKAHKAARPRGPDPDELIEEAVGRAEPANINVASTTVTRERIFLEQLRQQVYEQYRPAFAEVTDILTTRNFRRAELAGVGIENETNRFLNWLRLTHVIGDEAWHTVPLRPQQERLNIILPLGQEWTHTDDSKAPKYYKAWLHNVQRVFGSEQAIASARRRS